LNFGSAPDGIDDARELGKEAVASVLYDPAPVLGDLRINQFPKMCLEAFVRALLIPIRREYPATSATRIAVRRRTEGMARLATKCLTNRSAKLAPSLAASQRRLTARCVGTQYPPRLFAGCD
jgi:hypothetical protein